MTNHAGLQQLLGRELSSVEFVRGYVQMRFDGPCLSAYTMPTIETPSGVVIGPASPGYADALVAGIGRIVESAKHEDGESIVVRFFAGPTVRVSLRDSDRKVVEAATLVTDGRTIWTW